MPSHEPDPRRRALLDRRRRLRRRADRRSSARSLAAARTPRRPGADVPPARRPRRGDRLGRAARGRARRGARAHLAGAPSRRRGRARARRPPRRAATARRPPRTAGAGAPRRARRAASSRSCTSCSARSSASPAPAWAAATTGRKCYGYWFPPFDRRDLVIEVTHRYLAVALFVAIVALVVAGVAPSRGARRSRDAAASLRAARARARRSGSRRAIFGAVTVFTGNPPWATVVHKLLAASLLGRARGRRRCARAGSAAARAVTRRPGRRKAVRGATVAAGLALRRRAARRAHGEDPRRGGRLCAASRSAATGSLGGGAQHVQLTHRVARVPAACCISRRCRSSSAARRGGRGARRARVARRGVGVLQIVSAAWMVLGGFPARAALAASGDRHR